MPLVPFLLYVFVTSFTPGPNNMMAMAYANKYGFRKSLRFIFGVTAGIAVISLLSSYFNLFLYSFIPKIKVVMSMLGGLYLVYLAMRIMMNNPGGKQGGSEKSNSFLAGFLLQFVNPKVMLYGITAISTFVIPFFHSNSSLVLFSLFLAFAGFFGYRLLGNLWRNLSKDSLQIRKSFPYIHGTLIALQRCFHICRIDTVPVQDFSNTRPSTNKQR